MFIQMHLVIKKLILLALCLFLLGCSSSRNAVSREDYLSYHPDSNLLYFEKLVGNDYVHTPYFDISLVKMNVYPTNENIVKRLYGYPSDKSKVYLIEMFFAVCPNVYEKSETKEIMIEFAFNRLFDAPYESHNTFLLAPYEPLLMCFDTKETAIDEPPIFGFDSVYPKSYLEFSNSENEIVMAYWRRRTVFIGIKNEEKIEEMLPLIFSNSFYFSLEFSGKKSQRKYILNYPLEIKLKDPLKGITLEDINEKEVNIFTGNHWLLAEYDLNE